MAPILFPVDAAARPTFRDDFAAARSGGRTHAGIDIFAAEGSRVFAVAPGWVRFAENALGGHVAHLVTDDATWFYYAHLSAFEGAARRVKAGDVIGYVGKTGNAALTAPHLHFEVHPQGGAPVNPYPLLLGEPEHVGSWGRAGAWIGGSLAAGGLLGALVRGAA
jgi:murein DD-endopeptidase MepM/ murein hydrolase activator NlpD